MNTRVLDRPSTAKPRAPGWRSRLLLAQLERLQGGLLLLDLPDGSQRACGHGQPQVTLRVHDWAVFERVLASGDIGLAEAYRDGLCDCDDWVALIGLAIANRAALQQAIDGNWLGKLAYRLRHAFNANTRKGSRRNIAAHYDLGNAFYRLWLDDTMTYSSAAFDGDATQDLAQAQRRKYLRLLEGLNARPGQHILEIGCGWGGLAETAARAGLRVHGLTLSTEQLAYASERLANAGLARLAQCSLTDYRDLPPAARYDHIVSIEMFEAVGERYWPTYFATLKRHLSREGRAALQVITIADEQFEQYRRGTDFIQQYIFPGGMLPSRSVFEAQAARAGLKVVERRDFGIDYAITLERWRHAFEAKLEAIREQGYDEAFIRLWRFYLCYCEAGFRAGSIGVSHWWLEHA
ncbi:SAM-dependent methyltransferase [Chitinilyticum litopenaei]|uniref:SAM-dependent methyltransferase n=1 Tax=Chitinilyticum litopenaei TaxID=1121276 RepID=UPI0003FF2336|nr:cyclopropane-fatty-acyl-phospholipid synthase family protein [Chitinilyticum litopenaei]